MVSSFLRIACLCQFAKRTNERRAAEQEESEEGNRRVCIRMSCQAMELFRATPDEAFADNTCDPQTLCDCARWLDGGEGTC